MFLSTIIFIINRIKNYYNVFLTSCSSIAMGCYLHMNKDFFQEYTFFYFWGKHREIAFVISVLSLFFGVALLLSVFTKHKKIIRILSSCLSGLWLGVAAIFVTASPPASYWIFALFMFFVLIGNIKREVESGWAMNQLLYRL